MLERLLELLEILGVSQTEFAKSVGAPLNFVTELKSGRVKTISSDTLIAISNKYDVSLNWLLSGDGQMYVSKQAPVRQTDSLTHETTDPELKKAIDNLIKVAQKMDSSKQQSYLHGDLRELPELGRIAAGHLTEETAKQGKVLLFPRAIIPDKGPLFALRVRGDSMKDANIHDGDYAILKPVANPAELKPGAIVAALVDNENTLKKLYRDDGGAILRAANPAFQDIHVRNFQELVIQGHLKYLIKKWHDE